MTDEFKQIIDEDIERCEYEIKNGTKDSRYKLHSTLISKYGKIIDGLKDDLKRLHYDDSGEYRKLNLETMKQKLILFKAMEYKNGYSKDEKAGIIVNNTNQLSTTINISFDDVKKQVEEMTSLRDEEIDEIHTKIDELESIVNSTDRKTKKWARAKNIVKWIADKGVDVGIALLPLVLKIGQAQ